MKRKNRLSTSQAKTSYPKTLIHLITSAVMLVCMTGYGRAQDWHKATFDIGGGFSALSGKIHSRLENGWNARVEGGYNFTPHITASLDYTYNGFGVSRAVLNEAQVPSGTAHVWSLTVDPKVRFTPDSVVDPYVVGGVGYYRRAVDFTSPTIVPVLIFDPFFGAFFNTFVQRDIRLGTIRRGGVGGSLGAGIDFKLGQSGVKFFAEGRYHYADTGSVPTRMIPITAGFRW
jgi:opacity protein-like surface antigen